MLRLDRSSTADGPLALPSRSLRDSAARRAPNAARCTLYAFAIPAGCRFSIARLDAQHRIVEVPPPGQEDPRSRRSKPRWSQRPSSPRQLPTRIGRLRAFRENLVERRSPFICLICRLDPGRVEWTRSGEPASSHRGLVRQIGSLRDVAFTSTLLAVEHPSSRRNRFTTARRDHCGSGR